MKEINTYRSSCCLAFRPLLLLLLLSCFGAFQLFGQEEFESPYRLKWEKELVLGSGGFAALGTAAYLRSRMTLFTPEELESLDVEYVNEVDRVSTGWYFNSANEASDHFMRAAQVLPVLFLAGRKTRSHFGQIAVLYGETMLINAGLTTTIKYAVRRPRPYVYYPGSPISRIQSINAQSSFVSGHTSTVAAASFFMARVYSDFYPESEWKPVIWTAAALAPAVTGYLRIRSGKHYPTDVLGGYALGAMVGYFVPQLHRVRDDRRTNVTVTALPQGMHLSMTF